MATPLGLKDRLNRKLPRTLKAGRQWLRAVARGRRPATRVVFVVGSQRSGTRLPLQVMDYSPDIATFTEGSEPYFRGVLLEPLGRIEQLLRRSPSPVVALKPICETHRVNELLDRFPHSQAIWIFRNYRDAACSASLKWTSGREAVRRLAAGELHAAGWRAGGLTKDKLALVSRLYHEDMSLQEANAVMWYLRNSLFFDLGASLRRDVLLVCYEDLVASPHQRFARVFDFIGIPVPFGFEAVVHQGNGSRSQFPDVSEKVRTLCEELHGRLLQHYSAQTENQPECDRAVAQ